MKNKYTNQLIRCILWKERYTTTGNYTPPDNATNKTIGNQTGWFMQENGDSIFIFIKDKKVVQILAPNEETIASIIK